MDNRIVCTGTLGLDTTRTPFRTVENVLGGSAAYFSYSASFFVPVSVISVIGEDFPKGYLELLSRKGIDLSGVEKRDGEKNFAFDSEFSYDLYARKALKTELKILENYLPNLPHRLVETEFVYLGTFAPKQQLHLLEQFESPKLVIADTIEYYIENDRPALMDVMGRIDGLVINDIELRMLAQTHNLVKAAFTLLEKGLKLLVVKKGEHGCIIFSEEGAFPLPAFPLENVVDPTGAGDSFAGGFFGHIARKNGTLDQKTLKEATAYGTIMGATAVGDFSLNNLLNTTPEKIEETFHGYRRMLFF
ncbi:sugar kinase [Candidatus Micrarchaeota archaeon]|nr:sugar kinase [Candidatus Micrarchaeota archaeon]